MSYNHIVLEKREGIAYATVNRPKVLNALNAETIGELEGAFLDLRNDDRIRAVIVTGAGDKAFVAGADINELAEQSPEAGKNTALRGQRLFNLIERLGKPVIAAINGFALGGGCELALACALRIASEHATLGQPEVKLGIIPGYGGTQRLPRLVGKGAAMELILTGKMISAEEALRMGLVNKVVPQAELMPAAEAIAKEIMANGPVAVRYGLDAIHRGLEMTQEEGLFVEAALFGLLCTTEDMREGTRAFLEKRKPEFKGK